MTEAALPAGVLIRTAAASATATLGFVALIFFLRDRGRRDLLLYALLAFGTALHQGLRLGPGDAAEAAGGALRVRAALAFVLPATGYLFLLHFLDLPLTVLRKSLLALPALGLLAAVFLFPATRGILPSLAGLVLLSCGVELLWTLWREARKGRPDAPILFVAAAVLLLAALLEAAMERGILLLPVPGRAVLGPAFLVFTALVLVAVAAERQRLLLRATTDTLTGLQNRTTFLQRARNDLERSERTGEPLALVMFDIDHFKTVNDRFGHPAGDRVLAGVAHAIQTTIRGIDVVGRYGGEEFVLLLIDVEEEPSLVAVERIRRAIASLAPPSVPCRVTASAGIAVHHGRFERAKVEELIRRADAALYHSKQGGRDRSTVDEPPTPRSPSPADIRYR